ncbi:MAG: hypothetical protein HY242_09315 [Afipia sp.]|nr:hypothetical protein [Afipia sp.]
MPTDVKVNWLNLPQLEARIKNLRAPAILEVKEIAQELALTLGLGANVKFVDEARGEILTYSMPNKYNGYVYVEDGEYNFTESHGAESYQFVTGNAEKLIWRLNGFQHTPSEWRTLLKKSARAGYREGVAPITVPFWTKIRWRIERVWPTLGRLLRIPEPKKRRI